MPAAVRRRWYRQPGRSSPPLCIEEAEDDLVIDPGITGDDRDASLEDHLDTTKPILAVLDGAEALRTAVKAVFAHPVLARCQLHKIGNVTLVGDGISDAPALARADAQWRCPMAARIVVGVDGSEGSVPVPGDWRGEPAARSGSR